MKRISKFLHFSSSDRYLLVSASLWLGAIRLGLWLLPFQTLRRLLARMTPSTTESLEVNQATVDKVVWAVKVASRYIRGARCLAQALATQVLFARCGYSSCLCIGVARGKGGKLFAHAWVKSQGKTVIGGSGDMFRYTPLPLQEGESYERDRWYLSS